MNASRNLLGLILLYAAALSTSAFADEAPLRRSISVTGSATVNVVPDQVLLSVSVNTFAAKLEEAKQENDARVRRVLDAVGKFQIESKDVQTSHIGIQQRFEYSNNQRQYDKLLGYEVDKSVSILLRDIAKFEALFGAVLQAGVTRVSGIDFRTSEPRKYKDEAQVAAIKAAKEKAADLAGALGQKIGRPLAIDETSNVAPRRLPYVSATSTYQDADGGSAGGQTIAPGEIVLRASVAVTFELE